MTEELRYGIRPMGEDDISTVARLQAEVMPNPWSRGDFANSLSAGHLCLVVSDAACIKACAVSRVVAGEAELLTIATAGGFQRRGIAIRMLSWLMVHYIETGVNRCTLEVMPDNTAAVALYRQFGFQAIGRRADYYATPEGRADALVMQSEWVHKS